MTPADELRSFVFDEIVKHANADLAFKAVVEPLGFLTFVKLVDGLVEALTLAQIEQQDAAELATTHASDIDFAAWRYEANLIDKANDPRQEARVWGERCMTALDALHALMFKTEAKA